MNKCIFKHKYRKPVEGEVGYTTHNKICGRCWKLAAPTNNPTGSTE